MKIYTLFYSAIALTVATSFSACNDLDEAERFIEEPLRVEDTNRNVLVEDFTGQDCNNCPKAHELIEGLQHQYGEDRIIAVSIHGGSLSISGDKYPYGLANELGEYYNQYWGVEQWPNGIVNRGGLMVYTSWTTNIMADLLVQSPLTINVNKSYDEQTRTLSINVNTTSTEDVEGKLQVWLVEDGIVSRQIMPNGKRDMNYVHNNVLRAAVNGEWGTDYAIESEGSNWASFDYTISEDWEAENIAVVAFVYNNNGVIQAVKK